jgi:predicted nucleic acid-binding protein
MPRAKLQIVIDASVARAAGDVSMHPVSKNCRETLQALSNSELDIATCSALASEWKKHQSNYSRLWLISMIARGRFNCLPVEPINHDFRKCIGDNAETEKCADTMEKDAHLVEIALQTGKRIIALDETVRNLYKSLSRHHPPIRPVLWANPTIDDDLTVEWISGGCPSIARLKLGKK